MGTISGYVKYQVVLGTGTYTNPLTITTTGTVAYTGGFSAILGTAGTAWVIDNQGSIYGKLGIVLADGGIVTNSGIINGTVATGGVYITGAVGTVSNLAGTIDGRLYGVNLLAGGSVGNTGLIEGYYHNGVSVYGAAGTVSNSSTIISMGGRGVYLAAGGTITNSGAISGSIHGSRGGVLIGGAVGTVSNLAGTIYGNSYGVVLFAGGSLGNTGLIEGSYKNGVSVYGPTGAVSNSGTIIGVGGRGVDLYASGGVTNTGTGLIEGLTFGVYVKYVAGTVSNSGTIIASAGIFAGVRLQAGGNVGNTGLIKGSEGVAIYPATGTVTNSGTIVGTSGSGVDLRAGGTVVDSGTITGASGGAVYLGGTGANRLVLQHGYAFNGSGVVGSSSATNTVELAGSVGAAVTASYSALSLSYFADVLFGTGGNATLTVTNTTGTLPVTLSGFTLTSDVVDLIALAGGTLANGGTAVNNELIVSHGTDTVAFQLDPGESYTGLVWHTISDGSGGTDVVLAPVCYCRGTRILTERGEVAVEDLAIGDRVVTLSGAAQPVKWIGRRAYDGRFVAGNRAMLPVRIAAGALADGVPSRDLFVSPGHALYLNGVLVRAEHLVNGATVLQEERVERLEYFHIELEAHAIIIADGAAAESYVDCDNRAKFHNAADFSHLYPDDDRPRWQYCAPLVEWESAEADAIRAALLERAAALGHRLDLDPDLHLVVDGAVIPPAAVEGQIYRFAIPAGSAAVSLASRSIAPAEVEAAARDLRRLGAPIERLVLSDADLRIEAAHGHQGLADGFHADEPTHRWTDGLARLPESWLRAFPGTVTLEVHLIASGLPYRLTPPATTAAAA